MMTNTETRLSNRELDVLHLIVNEYTINEIALQLFISRHTVVSHRRSLQEKLKARNTAGIVRRAFELKYIEIVNE